MTKHEVKDNDTTTNTPAIWVVKRLLMVEWLASPIKPFIAFFNFEAVKSFNDIITRLCLTRICCQLTSSKDNYFILKLEGTSCACNN